MNGNSPITVHLDAQVPWLVTHYSEPAMLAPIGAPAATPETTLTHSFMHSNSSDTEKAIMAGMMHGKARISCVCCDMTTGLHEEPL